MLLSNKREFAEYLHGVLKCTVKDVMINFRQIKYTNPQSRGFGYIGLLITVALIALMATLGYSSLLSGGKSGERGTSDRGINAINEARAVKELMEKSNAGRSEM